MCSTQFLSRFQKSYDREDALFHVSLKANLSIDIYIPSIRKSSLIVSFRIKELELLVCCWELYYCKNKTKQ